MESVRLWPELQLDATWGIGTVIAHDPGVRLQEIGDQVGITERAALRIVAELVDAGYLVRERRGDARGRRAWPLRLTGLRRAAAWSYAAGR